ncbi:IS66 family insertion sequence element accessory protein TnpA [Paenibacillus sp. FA6]
MTKKEQKHQEWNMRIADYKANGLTMSAWCQANQLTKEIVPYFKQRGNYN